MLHPYEIKSDNTQGFNKILVNKSSILASVDPDFSISLGASRDASSMISTSSMKRASKSRNPSSPSQAVRGKKTVKWGR